MIIIKQLHLFQAINHDQLTENHAKEIPFFKVNLAMGFDCRLIEEILRGETSSET